MDEKRFVELLEINNKKLINEFNSKFEQIDGKLVQIDSRFEQIDGKLVQIDKRFEQIDRRFEELDNKFDKKINNLECKLDKEIRRLEEKIIDNAFYFEENYGKKIDAMFEKIMMDGEKNKVEHKEFENYMALTNSKLLSHEVRITELEKTSNS